MFGLLAAAILSSVVLGIFGYSNGRYYEQQHQKVIAAQERTNGKANPNQQIDTDRSGLPYIAQAITSNPEPKDTPESERRDLAAQESMSVWAFWALVTAFGSFVVTSIGTVFLLWQINLTREAVKDTGEATKAMREANKIAEDTARLQLRAYVDIREVSIVAPVYLGGEKMYPAYRDIAITVRNYGQTPARNVCLQTSVHAVEHGAPIPLFEKMRVVERADMAPGAEVKFTAPIARSHADITAIEADKSSLILNVHLSYEDQFGGASILKSAYAASGDDYKQGKIRSFLHPVS